MWVVLSIVVALLILAVLVLRVNPVFGRKASREKLRTYESSPNFRAGKFVNQTTTEMAMGLKAMGSMLRDSIKKNPDRVPKSPLPMETVDVTGLSQGSASTAPAPAKVTWFGHSALLVEIDGKTLLLDPMFGKSPHPFPAIGGKRYSKDVPIRVEDLPPIDAVLLSHDHYDHLDYDSIRKIKEQVRQFLVPLGVGSHLERWGVDPNLIQEHDWWDEFEYEGLRLACTPARHFSGRSVNDRNATLWCSWVIEGREHKIYFSGDGGYGPHFREIGEKYGPFDLTCMECGQYDERWSAIHMMPEETVQAHLDVRGQVLIPIHWAAFTLAFHAWTEPVERVSLAARKHGVTLATPKMGEAVAVGGDEYPNTPWWRS
ncbi:MBL fold metallo-hydrolase [Tumebacillus flagellatus]|uniref:Membrane protein n=1 Tax=Tumebacillus flagellatus TaxID=1157490 RepID=A0A074LTQ4_9BACL|nr:MBL fold metallo-hydrolase [Tumebacillus flagellatus]KEO84000.1 membrane protein [Tumebacillus flagellatus]